ncbi:Hypothetical predicted protein [Pelobates cultripes]|uniref:Uncharacterized protein n=1 Tax=Pelobates cultripes TaxID=61616 RepID=A0AAD1RXA7_PELCU|nr:Hypothetical predicted protein [Pelobates cultripes]
MADQHLTHAQYGGDTEKHTSDLTLSHGWMPRLEVAGETANGDISPERAPTRNTLLTTRYCSQGKATAKKTTYPNALHLNTHPRLRDSHHGGGEGEDQCRASKWRWRNLKQRDTLATRPNLPEHVVAL